MKSETSGSKDTINRREFLKRFLPKNHGVVFIDKEKCTGCTLCAVDCPTKALVVHPNSERDSFQLLFRQEACTACGECEKSCPEHCLKFIQREFEKDEIGKEIPVLFKEYMSRCIQCGIPLFPRSMVRKLEAKIFTKKGPAWQLNLCPSCRTNLQLSLSPLRFDSQRLAGEGAGEGGFQIEE